jgi:predicted MFS family arabinose efflux permease
MAAGEIAGPIVAGLVVASAGAGWAIAVDAASFAASAAFLSLMRVPARGPREASTFRSDLAGGWREVRSRTWVWSVVLSVSVAGGLWAAFSALGPVAADRGLGGAAAWGAILAALGAGALAGALLAIRLRPRRPLVVVALSYAVLSVPLAGLASGAHLAVVCISAFLAGIGLMLGNTVWESTLQRHVPAASLSRVSAYEWFGSLAFRPVGLAMWGPIAAGVGLSGALWLAFGLQLAAALMLLAVPEVRQLPAEAA